MEAAIFMDARTLSLGVLPESPLIKQAPLAIKWMKVSGASNPFIPPFPPTFPHQAHGIMGALRPAQEHTHTHTERVAEVTPCVGVLGRRPEEDTAII